MRKNISTLFIGLFLCAGIFMSFQDTERSVKIQQLVDKEVDKRIENYRNIRMKKCKEKILETAGKRADSIIIARAKEMKVLQDTLQRPIAPGRPDRPELLPPIDSSSPAPLLDSLQNSSGEE